MIKQLPNEIVSRVKLRTMFYTTPILVFPSNTVIAQHKTYYEQNGYVTNIFINLSLGHISNTNISTSLIPLSHVTSLPRGETPLSPMNCSLLSEAPHVSLLAPSCPTGNDPEDRWRGLPARAPPTHGRY